MRLEVPRTAKGERLDRYLTKAVPGLSLDRARTLCEQGHVRIREKPAQASRKLWGNETIDFHEPAAAAPPAFTDPGTPLPVLFEDDHLVVIDKPAGLVVERMGTHPSVVALLAHRLKGFTAEGRAEPAVVHRLDKETSGLMALPKTDAAKAALEKAFTEKQVDKRYLALVLGHPKKHADLDTPYGRDPNDPRLFTTKVRSARRARLSYDTLEWFPDAALVSIDLDTGRTHQIRVQLAESGTPVLADAVYGPQACRTHPAAIQLGRHALHATRLTLPHPADGRPLAFDAPPPADFQSALDLLRRTAT